MAIIANHAHLMPLYVEGQSWRHGDADMLLAHLDDCGIERAVVFPPFACQMDGSMRAANLWALQQVRKHADRFIAAGTVYPLADDILEMMHLLHGEGVRVLKVHPAIDLYDIADPAALPCYALAESLGMLLDFHTAPHHARLSLTSPIKYDDLAWNFPRLKLAFEHIGGRTYFEEFLAILHNHERGRVFGGLTSVISNPENRLWHLGPERITDIINCLGPESLIFGLDFPWNNAESNRRDIEIIRALDISEEAKAKILGGNLCTLLAC